jgi:hypothetical protein
MRLQRPSQPNGMRGKLLAIRNNEVTIMLLVSDFTTLVLTVISPKFRKGKHQINRLQYFYMTKLRR